MVLEPNMDASSVIIGGVLPTDSKGYEEEKGYPKILN
jgi:hypothetical protein